MMVVVHISPWLHPGFPSDFTLAVQVTVGCISVDHCTAQSAFVQGAMSRSLVTGTTSNVPLVLPAADTFWGLLERPHGSVWRFSGFAAENGDILLAP